MSRTLVVLTFIALIVVGVALGAGEACRSMAAERSVTRALTTHVLDVSTAERFASAQVRLSIVSNCTQFRPLRGRDLALST
jgi:hypothetical protein